jgi:hypothetical protein
MSTVLALIGPKGLYLLFIWLGSSIVCSLLSKRKGYGERPGLVTGMLLSAVGIVVWLLWPPRADSAWKLQGALGRRRGAGSLAAERAKLEDSKSA